MARRPPRCLQHKSRRLGGFLSLYFDPTMVAEESHNGAVKEYGTNSFIHRTEDYLYETGHGVAVMIRSCGSAVCVGILISDRSSLVNESKECSRSLYSSANNTRKLMHRPNRNHWYHKQMRSRSQLEYIKAVGHGVRVGGVQSWQVPATSS
jgi:hypothetical protein